MNICGCSCDQKDRQINDSKRGLALYSRNPGEFLDRYVNMDETWIQYYALPDKC